MIPETVVSFYQCNDAVKFSNFARERGIRCNIYKSNEIDGYEVSLYDCSEDDVLYLRGYKEGMDFVNLTVKGMKYGTRACERVVSFVLCDVMNPLAKSVIHGTVETGKKIIENAADVTSNYEKGGDFRNVKSIITNVFKRRKEG